MVAKLKEIIRINKAKCLPIKVFFIRPAVKRASKHEYCEKTALYFQSRASSAAIRNALMQFFQ